MKKKVLVIIPAYNEEKTIFNVVKLIDELNIPNLDVLVINDGSKDCTSLEAKKSNAIVIDLPFNLGIGGAVQTGYLYASQNAYEVAIQVDGDGQHNVDYIKILLDEMMESDVDMVIGSRFIEKNNYHQTFFRKLGIRFFSLLIKCLSGTKIYDVTSGYRIVNKKVISLFADYYPDDYPEVETIHFMLRNGLAIKEIPVKMSVREAGCSSITPFRSIYYMVKVTLALLLPKKRGV